MTSQLIIHYHGPTQDLTWLSRNAQGKVMIAPRTERAPDLRSLNTAQQIIVIVPGADVLVTPIQLAAKSRAQIQQAAPYAVEEMLCTPVEKMLVATASEQGVGMLTASVAKATLQVWQQDLIARGIRADVLLPETLALASDTNQPIALIQSDYSIVRLPQGHAFVVATAELDDWLAAASITSSLLVYRCADAPLVLAKGLQVSVIHQVESALALYAAQLPIAPALNLLSGEFASAHRHAPLLQWGKIAASLLLAVVILGFARLGLEHYALKIQLTELRIEMTDVFRSSFPQVQRLVGDPAAQMRSEMERLRGGSRGNQAMALLGKVGPVIAMSSQYSLAAVEYRNGNLEMTIKAADVKSIDALRESLDVVPGVLAELLTANADERGAEGRIRISEVQS